VPRACQHDVTIAFRAPREGGDGDVEQTRRLPPERVSVAANLNPDFAAAGEVPPVLARY